MSVATNSAGLRVAKAFLIAPLSGSIVFAGWYVPALRLDWLMGFIWTVIFAATVAYSIALVVGVPAYLVLRRLLRPRLFNVVLSGGLVATAPFTLLGIITVLGKPNPSMTWADVVEFIVFVGPIFAAGLVTGLAFWLIAVWRDPNPERYLASHGARGSCDSISS
jgi:hypothetical protein